MLRKDEEKRASLSEVLRSPVLFCYLQQLAKSRDAELHRLYGPKESQKEPQIPAEEPPGDARLTHWNPLNSLADDDPAAMNIKYSLSAEIDSGGESPRTVRRVHSSEDRNPFECEVEETPQETLRNRCADELGETLFARVYMYLKSQRQQHTDDDLVHST